jgi:hypothetical protein
MKQPRQGAGYRFSNIPLYRLPRKALNNKPKVKRPDAKRIEPYEFWRT